MNDAVDFQSALEDGERLLWQGRPDGALYRNRDRANRGWMQLVTWAVFGGLTVFMVFTIGPALGNSIVGTAIMMAAGVLFLLAGWYFTNGKPYFDAKRRAESRYALTNRRILTARKRGGKVGITGQKIHSSAPIKWDGQDPGDVLQVIQSEFHAALTQGFYRIAEAGKVHALMQAAQQELQGAANAKKGRQG